MENIVEWIRLSLVLGGTNAGGELVRKFGTAENILSRDPELLFKAGEISEETKNKLSNASLIKAQTIASVCRNFGWTVITPESEFFPEELKKISDFPLTLYLSGNPGLLKAEHKAAVVGTRHPSDISLTAAFRLASALSENGITTVSGGALGIDRASHEGALTGKGSTICVIGNGLGHNYLPERVFLKRRIEKYGLIVSEMPPFESPTHYSFPKRNRIIAALAKTLTVVQSQAKGGSLISADYALRYKKRVFALSPEVFSSKGCEGLISLGAQELKNASQIINCYVKSSAQFPLKNSGDSVPKILKPEKTPLSEFAALNGVSEAEAFPLYSLMLNPSENRAEFLGEGYIPTEKNKKAKTSKEKTPKYSEPQNILKEKIAETQGLSEAERAVYFSLGKQPQSLDSIADKTGLEISELMSAATVLELMELISYHPGNRVSLK
ncbi:MAG: DNA-processing protein DprA [Oscillospiraceae bacterium]|nr:DNA-processing protein DprA [Oscillospiraceae bacterium]